LNRFVGFHGKIVGFTVPVRWIDGRAVPGLHAAGDLLKVTKAVHIEVPLPDLPEEVS
jgi:hypothetical protein